MLRVSKKVTLAVEAVVDVAAHAGVAPVQSTEIAERLGLPKRYLEQVMQQLVRAGLLKGVRGPRGGYRLGREARRISVGDVFKVVRGRDDDEDQQSLGSDSRLGREVMLPFWASIEAEMMGRLEVVSIDELHRRATSARAVPLAEAEAAD
jgi:Rrf2 family protein